MAPWPAGPSGHWLLGNLREFRADRLGFLTRLAREYGDFVPFRLKRKPAVFVNDPDHVEAFISKRAGDYSKNYLTQFFHPLIRRHLLLSETDSWLEQRRQARPFLRPDRMPAYADVMVAGAERMCDEWQAAGRLPVASEMRRLTLDVLAKSLFDVDLSDVAAEAPAIVDAVLDDVSARAFAEVYVPIVVPTRANLRSLRRIRQADRLLDTLIADRRLQADGRHDLLSVMVAGVDGHGPGATNQEVKLAAIPLLFAGHETTAMALTWTLHLLARHPDVQRRLQGELDRILGSRRATAADARTLTFASHVVYESLRLYPPIWGFGREAVRDTQLDGYRIPAGTAVFASQWVLHRDARYFANPSDFDPDRWAEGLAARLPRCVYMPFGVGPRRCLGSTFAVLEAVLVLATVCRRFSLAPASDREPVPDPLITLRPQGGLSLIGHRRN